MAGNAYGFDFLKSENLGEGQYIPDQHNNVAAPTTITAAPNNSGANQKTDLEKQFEVIKFLQAHRSAGCQDPTTIYRATNIDLSEGGDDENVSRMLLKNVKIRTEEIPNPDYDPAEDLLNGNIPGDTPRTILAYGYQAKFNISEATGLLAQINRCKNGVAEKDLNDAYDGVKEDLNSLISGGEIVAVANPEDKDRTLFPRGEPFWVEIEGNVCLGEGLLGLSSKEEEELMGLEQAVVAAAIPFGGEDEGAAALRQQRIGRLATLRQKRDQQHNNNGGTTINNDGTYLVETDTDARKQVRRGEAVWVGGQWFRVSSAVREGIPLSEQPARAQAPPSVSLQKDLSKKNEQDGYIRPFTMERLPLDYSLSKTAVANLKNAKEARAKLVALGVKDTTNSSSSVMRKRPTSSKNASAAAAKIKAALSDPALVYSHARRHGCTTDIKSMYLQTRADVPESDIDLFKMLVSAKLVDEGEAMRRPRMKKKTGTHDGKPKKRRYYQRKNQRNTNTHLQGTEIGAALAAAAERQQQGKSVGDGGM